MSVPSIVKEARETSPSTSKKSTQMKKR